MNLQKLLLTRNDCYKAGVPMKPQGVMVHSTGANNPWLRRYVGPDDGRLGVNTGGTHWNTATPDGRKVCVHGFIGKLADGTVATYQTLPWDMRGWHAGGSANRTHIGFEICEDGLADLAYFSAVYKEAVELCVYLCRQFGLTERNIICHSEGYKLGVSSNHGDVMHWFPRHGKDMDTFRAAVKAALSEEGEGMTQAQFDEMMADWQARKNPVYKSMADVPDYWKAEAQALKAAGAIQGNGVDALGVARDTLKAAVICKRYVDAVR